eukprot:TRINITY_DN1312_c0_g1_i1.p1 TRINITY_DN1312_c0_g1~~TRINITY_DN1312_c0_g1_i1.p1  ORF type:complete len:181 (+),score=42.09 TRINITY_DN1312_c0_g1_i1:219-761(+)
MLKANVLFDDQQIEDYRARYALLLKQYLELLAAKDKVKTKVTLNKDMLSTLLRHMLEEIESSSAKLTTRLDQSQESFTESYTVQEEIVEDQGKINPELKEDDIAYDIEVKKDDELGEAKLHVHHAESRIHALRARLHRKKKKTRTVTKTREVKREREEDRHLLSMQPKTRVRSGSDPKNA